MLNLFLQAFDEGWITDGRGKRVYLSDAIVIMTSNIGSRALPEADQPARVPLEAGRRRADPGRDHARAGAPVLAGVPQPHRRSRDLRAADEGRSAADRAAADRARSKRRSRGAAARCRVTPAALEQLVPDGYSLAYGARFLKRVIEDRRSSCRSATSGRRGRHSWRTCAKDASSSRSNRPRAASRHSPRPPEPAVTTSKRPCSAGSVGRGRFCFLSLHGPVIDVMLLLEHVDQPADGRAHTPSPRTRRRRAADSSRPCAETRARESP